MSQGKGKGKGKGKFPVQASLAKKAKANDPNRKQLIFRPYMIRKKLVRERYMPRVSDTACLWLSGALETLVTEILDLAAERAKAKAKSIIKPTHIIAALKNDEELNATFKNVTIANHAHPAGPKAKSNSSKATKSS